MSASGHVEVEQLPTIPGEVNRLPIRLVREWQAVGLDVKEPASGTEPLRGVDDPARFPAIARRLVARRIVDLDHRRWRSDSAGRQWESPDLRRPLEPRIGRVLLHHQRGQTSIDIVRRRPTALGTGRPREQSELGVMRRIGSIELHPVYRAGQIAHGILGGSADLYPIAAGVHKVDRWAGETIGLLLPISSILEPHEGKSTEGVHRGLERGRGGVGRREAAEVAAKRNCGRRMSLSRFGSSVWCCETGRIWATDIYARS
jgi:hypothetical protein